jgi:hypothetical protein
VKRDTRVGSRTAALPEEKRDLKFWIRRSETPRILDLELSLVSPVP